MDTRMPGQPAARVGAKRATHRTTAKLPRQQPVAPGHLISRFSYSGASHKLDVDRLQSNIGIN